MKKYEPQWYETPINLPEGRSGKVRLRHRILDPGEKVTVVGIRQSITRGVPPVMGLVKKPLRVHELVEEDAGVWMTDLPEELNQIAEMLHTVRPRGRVLVGGLGLGLVAETLLTLPPVTEIVVVERVADVIKLCANLRPGGYRMVQADIGDFLRLHRHPFDYYLLDTWQATNEGTWFDDVLPLRRAIRQRWGKKPVVHCWAEDIMLGQVVRSLTTVEPHWYYTPLPVPMTLTRARQFVRDVGLPTWERIYGVAIDRYVEEQNRREALEVQ